MLIVDIDEAKVLSSKLFNNHDEDDKFTEWSETA
jgi:hypothetical protein